MTTATSFDPHAVPDRAHRPRRSGGGGDLGIAARLARAGSRAARSTPPPETRCPARRAAGRCGARAFDLADHARGEIGQRRAALRRSRHWESASPASSSPRRRRRGTAPCRSPRPAAGRGWSRRSSSGSSPPPRRASTPTASCPAARRRFRRSGSARNSRRRRSPSVTLSPPASASAARRAFSPRA